MTQEDVLFAMRWCRSFRVLFLAAAWLLPATRGTQLRAQTSTEQGSSKRPITIADGVEMTRLEEPDSEAGRSSIGHFSPDEKRFVVVQRKANLARDTNDFSLLLYQTVDVFRSPHADFLVTMSSSSIRPAISMVRWLSDNETLVFIGENPGENSQVYSFNTSTRVLKKLTAHPTAITNYDITGDGRVLAFIAEPPELHKPALEKGGSPGEIVIAGQRLSDILAGSYSLPNDESGGEMQLQVFWQRSASPEVPVPPVHGHVTNNWALSLSPDGRYLVFPANVLNIPAGWAQYQDKLMQEIIAAHVFSNSISPLYQYLLFDSANITVAPLVDAPMPLATKVGQDVWVHWGVGGRLFVTSYLPLDVGDLNERAARERNPSPLQVRLPSREYRKVSRNDFPASPGKKHPVDLPLGQNLNTPPKLYVLDPKTNQKTLLLDLNPQFNNLDFGIVKTVELNVDGVVMLAGLYLPPDYDPGKRYPLVIQTHGFEPEEFSMDGRSEWSSAFAARPLAAKGMVVFQYGEFKSPEDSNNVPNDRKLGATPEESAKRFHILALERAIDYLDGQGLIDRDRIGVSGFSRFVCFVGYMLTHSKYPIAAATLVDGTSCGYFEEIAVPDVAWDISNMNGGTMPFGEGLKPWLKNSPSFNLDKVQTPIRLAAFGNGSVLSLWEWYVGLSLQKKPVDFVVIPRATHIGAKLSQRVLTQQGVVDWFSFWLKGEEDPDPAKAPQYARWRELKALQAESDKKSTENHAAANCGGGALCTKLKSQ